MKPCRRRVPERATKRIGHSSLESAVRRVQRTQSVPQSPQSPIKKNHRGIEPSADSRTPSFGVKSSQLSNAVTVIRKRSTQLEWGESSTVLCSTYRRIRSLNVSVDFGHAAQGLAVCCRGQPSISDRWVYSSQRVGLQNSSLSPSRQTLYS